MKKYLLILIFFLSLILLTSCNKNKLMIKIYNSSDYIDETILDEFIDWYRENIEDVEIGYIYDNFETNESMYNTLRTGKTDYDLCCPSDYMIQKMKRENMLEEFDFENYDINIYLENCSPYILNLFENAGWDKYAACYMWGTLGVIYNPSELGMLMDSKDGDDYYYEVTSWQDFNNPKFKGKVSLKDSVRDSYCVASILSNIDELNLFDNRSPEYNDLINDVINRVTDEDIDKALVQLRKLKENIFGLEVDSAKGDIVTGKIAMNLAWSGDAVYSIDQADEEGVELRYNVPDEGGNVWFDAWVMPKGANKKLAMAFINFISQPSIAKRNMEEIGYTSSIAGDEIFNLIDEWYGEESNKMAVAECEALYMEDPSEENKEALNEALAYLEEAQYEDIDLTYFFDGTLTENLLTDGLAIIKIDTSYIGRQFSTQYPDEDTLNRCGIMKDFEDQNEKVLQMWIIFRANEASIYLIISLVLFLFICGGIYLYTKQSYFQRIRRKRKQDKQLK